MNEMLEIEWRRAVNRDALARPWMNKLETHCMKSDASDQPLARFGCVIFSVSDHRVADGRKLHPDLILQTSNKLNANE